MSRAFIPASAGTSHHGAVMHEAKEYVRSDVYRRIFLYPEAPDLRRLLLPKLKNGEQPRRQKVMAEIRKIAAPSEGKYWILQTIQHEFPFVMPKEAAGQSATMSLSKPEEHYDHNEMILILAKLGRAAG